MRLSLLLVLASVSWTAADQTRAGRGAAEHDLGGAERAHSAPNDDVPKDTCTGDFGGDTTASGEMYKWGKCPPNFDQADKCRNVTIEELHPLSIADWIRVCTCKESHECKDPFGKAVIQYWQVRSSWPCAFARS